MTGMMNQGSTVKAAIGVIQRARLHGTAPLDEAGYSSNAISSNDCAPVKPRSLDMD